MTAPVMPLSSREVRSHVGLSAQGGDREVQRDDLGKNGSNYQQARRHGGRQTLPLRRDGRFRRRTARLRDLEDHHGRFGSEDRRRFQEGDQEGGKQDLRLGERHPRSEGLHCRLRRDDHRSREGHRPRSRLHPKRHSA